MRRRLAWGFSDSWQLGVRGWGLGFPCTGRGLCGLISQSCKRRENWAFLSVCPDLGQKEKRWGLKAVSLQSDSLLPVLKKGIEKPTD